MSRYNRSRGSLTRGRVASWQFDITPPPEEEPYWFDEPMPEPWQAYLWRDWQEAWAETTLSVCETTWRKQGNRMYGVHRDHALREDLKDWLWVEAQNLANDYTPHPDADDPRQYWAAYLTRGLRPRARWHFGQVVGDLASPGGRAAADAHNRGDSLDRLQDVEDETGYRVRSRPLHGYDLFATNPEDILVHIETFVADLKAAQGHGRGSYRSASDGVCIISQCERPIAHKNMCTRHYERERKVGGKTCTIPGCERIYSGRGLCHTHLQHYHKGKLDPALHQFVQAKKTSPTTCTTPGCEEPHKSKGLCARCYEKARRKAKAS